MSLTDTDIANAGLDLQSISDVVNGSPTLNGTGTVTTRQGQTIKTLSRVQQDNAAALPALGYATETALLADLTPGNRALAYAVDTNKFYVKSGASGAGSWTTGPTAPRTAPNMLFDSFNRYTYNYPNLGGWNWFEGSSTITWDLASANIPIKTPVAKTGAVAGGFRKVWDTSKISGFRAGETLTVSALVFASAAGGARISVYVRDSSNANLASNVPSFSGVAGLQVVSATVTIPSGAHAKLLFVVEGSGNTAIETGAICASLSNRPPQLTPGPLEPDSMLAWLNATSLDSRFLATASASALATALAAFDAITPLSKNMFNINDPDVVLGSFVNFGTGLTSANASYNTTGFIPVVPGQTYTASNTGQRAYYNASKVYVSGDNVTGALTASTFTVPAGCFFVRCSVFLTGGPTEWANFQVEAGSSETSFVPYGRVFAAGAFSGLTVGTSVLVDGAVTPVKTNFMQASKNLFNPSDPDVVLGSYINYLNGNPTVNASYNGTGFIPVVPGQTYTITFSHQRAFYNASKVFVSGTNSGNPATFTVPAGCFFVRCSVTLAAWAGFQLELGSTSTSYVPFGYKLADAYIPDTVWNGITAAQEIGGSFNAHTLRNYHYLREKRTRTTPESARSIIALVGDSYTHNAARYSGGFAAAEQAEQGDGGAGYIGFSFGTAGTTPYALGGNQPSLKNGNVRSAYTMDLVGTWTASYGTVPTPDICAVTSSTAGDRIVVGIPATSGGNYPALSSCDLFWVATANGVVRYSWNGGTTWTSLNVQGTVGNCVFAALANVPTGGGAATLIIEVVSGTCTLGGCNPISSADGVVVHKLGATGRRAQDFATQALNASWASGIARLGLTTFQILHGTNDQGSSRTPAQFSADLETVCDAVLATLPGCDIAIVQPAENQRSGNTVTMKSLTAAAAQLCYINDWAFYDTQQDFGSADAPALYGSSGARPLYNADLVHPEPATGGRAMENALKRFYRYAA